MRKTNSTTSKPIASRARYRHPSSLYQNARQLRLTMETESPEMQRLLVSRLFAMADYLFSTTATGVLAERMYMALADAWECNRLTYGDTPQNPWDHTTVEHHTAILHAIDYADENREDEVLDRELEALRQATRNAPTPLRTVVRIEEWKRSR
jgi:hypothetical protein